MSHNGGKGLRYFNHQVYNLKINLSLPVKKLEAARQIRDE